MSDKKRRDITLGEMQDECKRRNGECDAIENDCGYMDICDELVLRRKFGELGEILQWKSPDMWNFTDPPRFNEAQMALLKAFFDIGGVIVRANSISTTNYIVENLNGTSIGAIFARIGFKLDDGETLDLAEMFGSEGK